VERKPDDDNAMMDRKAFAIEPVMILDVAVCCATELSEKSRGISSVLVQEFRQLLCNVFGSWRFDWCNRHRWIVDSR
jgi:hypothetical protein